MALRHLFQLFDFFSAAGDYATPGDDTFDEADSDATKHLSYHRRIVYISAFFGLLGAIAGLVFCWVTVTGKVKAKDSDLGKIWLAPLMFAAQGLVCGVSLACLFAPRGFYTGPVGQKWMRLIGTKSPFVARMVCFILSLLFTAFLALLAWIAWIEFTKPPGTPLF